LEGYGWSMGGTQAIWASQLGRPRRSWRARGATAHGNRGERLPPSAYGVAAVAGAFSGYAGGLGKRSSRLPMYVMIFLIAAVILLIQDLDRPSTGFITTSQQPMIDTADAIAKY